ncbi:hypothetical protein [Clostridium sp.]|uniref:hypothetical protein n=1 Tax=Clostridium sp. TaxID=1506 RepID=UPI002FCC19AA
MKNENLRKVLGLSLTLSLIVALFITSINMRKEEMVAERKSPSEINLSSVHILGNMINKRDEVQCAAMKDDIGRPQVQVSVDLEVVEREQSSVDEGHSPWKLDPAFVAQVFVSLKIFPQGIQGDYPIKYEEFKVVQNTGKDAVVEVSAKDTPIKAVYLKRLIKQDNTGIWTVVGYNPSN